MQRGHYGTKRYQGAILGGTYGNEKEVFYGEDGERKGVPGCTSTSVIQLSDLIGKVTS